MRAITNSVGLSVCLEDPVEDLDPVNPRRHIIIKPGLRADFISDTTEYEQKVAKERFKFNGLPVDEDTGLPVDPAFRIGSFDTELQGWDEATRKKAEKLLVESKANGVDYIIVETPLPQAPWKGYDSIRSVKKLLELVVETGSDANDVLAYEKATKNRPEVIDALNVILTPAVEEDAMVISA